MEQTSSPHTATPDSAPAASTSRCRSRKRKGGRCHLPVQDPSTGRCFVHAHLGQTAVSAPDRDDLSTDLFGPAPPSFESAEEINHTLTNLITLVAQGRLSSRRAAVISYALSLILRGLQAIEKSAASAPTQVIVDIPFNYHRPATASNSSDEPAPPITSPALPATRSDPPAVPPAPPDWLSRPRT